MSDFEAGMRPRTGAGLEGAYFYKREGMAYFSGKKGRVGREGKRGRVSSI